MPQLDPTWFISQLFWLFISCFVLYLTLSFAILPRLQRVLGERDVQRQRDLAAAEVARSQAETAQHQYERALADARIRAQQLFADSDLAAKRAALQSSAEMEAQIARHITAAEKRIAITRAAFLEQLQIAAAEMAQQIVERISGVTPSREDAQSAVLKAESARLNSFS